ncbi:MAG: prepilin-type N-terminal cleavage/methylation domain-containing protein [Candidatus Paceibacterota bacterium]
MYNFKKGFTLIELLVVIAIIGILAAIVMTSMEASRDKARVSAAKSEIIQIAKAVDAARAMGGKMYLKDITLSGWTWGGGVGDAEGRFRVALQRISAASGTFNSLDQILLDPWGSVYMLDENEGEQSGNPCRIDTISTQNGQVRYRFSYGSEYCTFQAPQGSPGFY